MSAVFGCRRDVYSREGKRKCEFFENRFFTVAEITSLCYNFRMEKRGVEDVMKEKYIVRSSAFPYLVSPLFERYDIHHMFTTRRGGISTGVFDSLNFAVGQGSVRDDSANVDYHHRLAAETFGLTPADTVRAWQLHTANVEIASRENCGVPYNRGVDGLMTDEKGILLTVRTADCVPVLLYDIEKRVCAAVHAGWRGTASGIAANAVALMKREYGSDAKSVIAAIGPSARLCCYEVGDDVRSAFGREYDGCFEIRDGKMYFDTAQANAVQLLGAGLDDAHISDCGICTVCNDDFYSHRRQGINRGSLAAFITV